ncbi:hypothetical protein [Vagococcus hydrophili]|uniref:Uncharacterized protein n=1 Tax=Vagococcus hydrophili TaxID=2714947 RepID=A0A6G8AW98_9ENTE|nr:hypothetical protein [Vagococcus hydrophili]QIL49239.1 hypothetical protein G7082_12430 [Vagococcus hydrophili]
MKKKLICTALIIVIALFMFIHTNSNRSLRFTVMLHGFPKEALHSKINYSFKDGENTKYYFLDPTPVSSATGPTNAWEVKKVGIFYFSSYFGA